MQLAVQDAGGRSTGGALRRSLRVTEYFARVFAKSWRASVVAAVANPVLYLLALGVGLGSLVDRGGHTAALGHVSYLAFVAPALAAATAMEVAASDATFPVFGCIRWNRTYEAMTATPVGPAEILTGHLLWILARVGVAVTGFLVVVAAFGALRSPLAVLDLPAGLLTGAAFAAPLAAFSAAQREESVFPLMFRLGIIPLFLFSGTFFPLSQLPGWLRIVALATPLYHGVALARALSLGSPPVAPTLAHVAYLAALAVLGYLAGIRVYRRRLAS